MTPDLDALRKRLRPKWSHSRKTERECYMDGVDAALAALEQVGWCYSYSDGGTSVLYESEGPKKPDDNGIGWVSTLYRVITPDTEGEGR